MGAISKGRSTPEEAKRLIAEAGGVRQLARSLCISPQAVSRWQVDGIPDYRMSQIVLLKIHEQSRGVLTGGADADARSNS